jgi:hypothetical protein
MRRIGLLIATLVALADLIDENEAYLPIIVE